MSTWQDDRNEATAYYEMPTKKENPTNGSKPGHKKPRSNKIPVRLVKKPDPVFPDPDPVWVKNPSHDQ